MNFDTPRTSTTKVAVSDYYNFNQDYIKKMTEEREKIATRGAFEFTPSPSFYQIIPPKKKVKEPKEGECLVGEECLFTAPSKYTNLVPFGSNKVRNKTQQLSITDTETIDIQQALKVYNSKLRKGDMVVKEYNAKDWRRYPREVKHPLRDKLVTFIKRELRVMFPNRNVQISGIPYLIAETLDTIKNGNNLIEFNVYIFDNEKFMSRRLKIQVITRGDHIIQVNNVKLDKSNDVQLKTNVKPRSNNREYVETLNTMYLMAPFKSNLGVSQMTAHDHDAFNQKLQETKVIETPEFEYACFGSLNVDAKNKFDCINAAGVWDSPVRNNTECPYYMSNSNYPNVFGGKKGYSCDVPLGVKLLGYRNPSVDPKDAPLCYNCKDKLTGQGTLGRCCEDQKDNQMYPKLETPDYAFGGDTQQRLKHKKLFEYRGLSLE